MRRVIILLVIMVFCVSCASSPFNSRPFEDWTRADTVRSVAMTGLIGVDWMQTKEIARNPNYKEVTNLIIGEHPSQQAVDLWMVYSLIVTNVAAAYLKPEYRKWFQAGIITMEVGCTVNNYAIGIRF